ncbi:MAG TPA: putative glycoside hydrolase [Candidatus Pacearchaeota archaeon]|nr:putative glycoside hydrolase [Candidatus Pacearchaeota archaeon]HPR80228.1 putative glycoside hydrolase [Candidatus Pacearchaeota archaeon]
MNKWFLLIIFIILISLGVFIFIPKEKIGGINSVKENKVLPDKIMAVYLTSWSASNSAKIDYIIDLSKKTEINAVVIDVKDWSGKIPYSTNVSLAKKYGAERVIIKDMKGLIDKLHNEGLYVIARITVFQDPVLAYNRSDLAIKNLSGGTWYDYNGLAWIDPTKKEGWDYNISIAKDALSNGFDEVNFDYIRFPSDGNLNNMNVDFSTEREVLKSFYQYLRSELKGETISADLFGLTTVNLDGLGIGQVIEDAYEYFDFVCPMVYPSHYASGFIGFENPADHPFEVVAYSMAKAKIRISNYNSKLRPWLQDFNLGATYDTEKVYLQIKAVKEILTDKYYGYMIWSPTNLYNEEAIIKGEN